MSKSQELAVEYASGFSLNKKKDILTVEKAWSSVVRRVELQNDTHILIEVNGERIYTYKDTAKEIKKLFKRFVTSYTKIKEGGEAEREQYSLGRLWTAVNKIYPKKTATEFVP